MNQVSYAIGLNIGINLKDLGATDINLDDFAAAIKDVFEGRETKIATDDAQAIVQEYLQKKSGEKNKSLREAGEKYLAENVGKDGVKTTASGLQYKVLREGSGKQPKATDKVKCHYEGMLIDGTLFDSSIRRGEPAVFGLNQVIAGWTEGLQLMKEGAKYRFFIPYQLGYGENGAGQSIPPYAALIFDVELIEVV